MGMKLDLNEIVGRKTDLNKKSSNSNVNKTSEKIKKNEIIELPIHDEDDKLIQAFKNFINEQKTTIQEMEESGVFKEAEAYNIIYNLKKSYKTVSNSDGKIKRIKPQFSWMRAEKILNYFGYDIEFVFNKIEDK